MAFTQPIVYRQVVSNRTPWLVDYKDREFLYVLAPYTMVLYSDVKDQGPAIFAPNQLQLCPFRNSDRANIITPGVKVAFYVIASDDVIATAGVPTAREFTQQMNISGFGWISTSGKIGSSVNPGINAAFQLETDGSQEETIVVTSMQVVGVTLSQAAQVQLRQGGSSTTLTPVSVLSTAAGAFQFSGGGSLDGITVSSSPNNFSTSASLQPFLFAESILNPLGVVEFLNPTQPFTIGQYTTSTIQATANIFTVNNQVAFNMRFFTF